MAVYTAALREAGIVLLPARLYVAVGRSVELSDKRKT